MVASVLYMSMSLDGYDAGPNDVPEKRRLFEVLPARIELDIVRVIDTPQASHIRYRTRR